MGNLFEISIWEINTLLIFYIGTVINPYVFNSIVFGEFWWDYDFIRAFWIVRIDLRFY